MKWRDNIAMFTLLWLRVLTSTKRWVARQRPSCLVTCVRAYLLNKDLGILGLLGFIGYLGLVVLDSKYTHTEIT